MATDQPARRISGSDGGQRGRRSAHVGRVGTGAKASAYYRSQASLLLRCGIRLASQTSPCFPRPTTEATLCYWPEIQGRGEFVWLALEQAAVPYTDPDREDEAVIEAFLDDASIPTPPSAPPFLVAGQLVIVQTANILLYLSQYYDLAPHNEVGGLWTYGLQLTIADFAVEIHDTHHPIASYEYYEDQYTEAKRRIQDFLDNRVPKFPHYFERVLDRNPVGPTWVARDALIYADLSSFQIVVELRYAFPRRMQRYKRELPHLAALHDRVAALPNIAAHLESPCRIPLNTMGIFCHYPEFDALK